MASQVVADTPAEELAFRLAVRCLGILKEMDSPFEDYRIATTLCDIASMAEPYSHDCKIDDGAGTVVVLAPLLDELACLDLGDDMEKYRRRIMAFGHTAEKMSPPDARSSD